MSQLPTRELKIPVKTKTEPIDWSFSIQTHICQGPMGSGKTTLIDMTLDSIRTTLDNNFEVHDFYQISQQMDKLMMERLERGLPVTYVPILKSKHEEFQSSREKAETLFRKKFRKIFPKPFRVIEKPTEGIPHYAHEKTTMWHTLVLHIPDLALLCACDETLIATSADRDGIANLPIHEKPLLSKTYRPPIKMIYQSMPSPKTVLARVRELKPIHPMSSHMLFPHYVGYPSFETQRRLQKKWKRIIANLDYVIEIYYKRWIADKSRGLITENFVQRFKLIIFVDSGPLNDIPYHHLRYLSGEFPWQTTALLMHNSYLINRNLMDVLLKYTNPVDTFNSFIMIHSFNECPAQLYRNVLKRNRASEVDIPPPGMLMNLLKMLVYAFQDLPKIMEFMDLKHRFLNGELQHPHVTSYPPTDYRSKIPYYTCASVQHGYYNILIFDHKIDYQNIQNPLQKEDEIEKLTFLTMHFKPLKMCLGSDIYSRVRLGVPYTFPNIIRKHRKKLEEEVARSSYSLY